MISRNSYVAIAEDLGSRLKQARLNRNVTQAELAAQLGLTRKVIVNAEKGDVRLETFVAILIAMDLVESLDLFLPPQPISPISLARLQGKQRQRASGSMKSKNEIDLKW
ncbi:helix-turn-helix transcriptional regulator [Cellvibrio sp. UBA7661]|uniref:helix-turn-helix domain-containing protein n=1 Tax=Cellvibrio sp. UBA7661 TaxID=1946311 RepID=UPI002F35C292